MMQWRYRISYLTVALYLGLLAFACFALLVALPNTGWLWLFILGLGAWAVIQWQRIFTCPIKYVHYVNEQWTVTLVGGDSQPIDITSFSIFIHRCAVLNVRLPHGQRWQLGLAWDNCSDETFRILVRLLR